MILRVLEVVAGVLLVAVVLDAAIRTFVLPRGVQVRLTRAVSLVTRTAFDAVARPNRDHAARDRVLALYGPVTLLTLPLVWIGLTWFGFALVYQGLLDVTFLEAARDSGSSLFTLGFAVPVQGWSLVVVFLEATVGLGLLALLISYLPTIYGTFSRRELAVTQLSVRAGSPPSPVEMLTRAHRAGYLLQLDPYWTQWEHWFVELEETHTSLALVSFFRSPDPSRHWLVAAAVVLDSAALRFAALDVPFSPAAGLCLRSGYLSLRAIARFFDVPFDNDPRPDDPISVERAELDAVVDELVAAGLPVKADRDQIWRDFAGWRVNYDAVLVALAGLYDPPPTPWVTDRAGRFRPPMGGHRAAARRDRRAARNHAAASPSA